MSQRINNKCNKLTKNISLSFAATSRILETVRWVISATLLTVKLNYVTLVILFLRKSGSKQLSNCLTLRLLLHANIKIKEIDNQQLWWIIVCKIEVMRIIRTSKRLSVSSLRQVKTVHTLRDALLLMEILSCVWIPNKTNSQWTMVNNNSKIILMVDFRCLLTLIYMACRVCSRPTRISIPWLPSNRL